MGEYTAKLLKDRANSWVVEFRHPMLNNRQGKIGLKIRRGLGPNESEAERVVKDINEILQDKSYWSLTQQQRAIDKFDSKAVAIFYGHMEEEILEDPWKIREQHIPMPDTEEGYARVMFLGTTGSGKTTVIRQLVGTDPDELSFPAISPSRTTTCDTEFIFSSDKSSKVVVTFLSQSLTRRLIEESIWEAIKRAIIRDDKKRIAKALLSHPENRFRLSYLLGQFKNEPPVYKSEETANVPYPDYKALKDELDYILSEIENIANEAREACPVDQEEIDEAIELLYEDFVWEDTERFHDLVDHILGKIKQRFGVIRVGEFHWTVSEWPEYWTYESTNKSEVVELMRWFAGNDGRRFGQLLAPLVSGIRISAPFKPSWWEGDPPRLVLIDGQGIGHESNITTSLSIELTGRFKDIDVVVIVDNAAQPMLDIPKIVLRDAASRGQTDKLVITYTHFDQVDGANLLDSDEQKDHVLGIQDRAIEAFQEVYNLNPAMVRKLREHMSEYSFFLSQANDLKNSSVDLRDELDRFISTCIDIAQPVLQPGEVAIPDYDYGNLVVTIDESERPFMEKWLGLLGFRPSRLFPKQHWARIKALANRLAHWPNTTSYMELEPASDLASLLIQRLDTFLRSPIGWRGNAHPTEDDKQYIINKIIGTISDEINDMVVKRLKAEHHGEWLIAYSYTGRNSTKLRASDIWDIFKQVIPNSQFTNDKISGEFVAIIKEIVDGAIKIVSENVESNGIDVGV